MLTAYIHATVLDGTRNMEPQNDTTVVVQNDRILSVGQPAPAGCRVIDLAGRTLVPGLINLHVHLPGSGMPKETSQQNPESVRKLLGNPVTRRIVRGLCEKYARTELYSGVTTIRTVGGVGTIDTAIRDRVAAGKLAGPRILAADNAVTVAGGHMAGTVARVAKTAEECRAQVRDIAATHPNLIKLMITGGVLDATVKGEPGVLKMSPELVSACCDEAHRLGLPVAAHVESPQGVRVALENGVDTIEHGAALDEALIALFREKGASLVCTISPAIPLAHFDNTLMKSTELTKFNGNVVFEGIVACAKAALAAGIPVGLGTDTACPFVTHYDMWRELQYFHRFVGVSQKEALYTATLGNATILGLQAETGSVEAGKCADFLIVDGNPLENLAALRTPYMVVARGRAFAHPRVKKFPLVEEALDRELEE